MKKEKINDERVLAESNKVYKTCFIALCIGIFVDTVFKFTAWYYYNPNPTVSKDGMFLSNGDVLPFYVIWGIEALLLATVFLLCLFSLAKKGIMLGDNNIERKRFAAGRFALISLIAASTVFILILLSHLITSLPIGSGSSEYGAWGVVIMLLVYALITVPIFAFFYLMFYVAFKVTKSSVRNSEKE